MRFSEVIALVCRMSVEPDQGNGVSDHKQPYDDTKTPCDDVHHRFRLSLKDKITPGNINKSTHKNSRYDRPDQIAHFFLAFACDLLIARRKIFRGQYMSVAVGIVKPCAVGLYSGIVKTR